MENKKGGGAGNFFTVARKCGIDTTDRDENTRVHDSRSTATGRRSDADDEADPDGAHAGEDVGGALPGAVGKPGHGDGEDGGGDVDGDGE